MVYTLHIVAENDKGMRSATFFLVSGQVYFVLDPDLLFLHRNVPDPNPAIGRLSLNSPKNNIFDTLNIWIMFQIKMTN